MNSKTLRRLASEHANLHTQGLPPNYLWPPSASSELPDDLTALTILIIGPEGTPFSEGVFQLNIQIPSGYPAAAPTAAFKTKIFHPNVDEKTGAVCVDTLKRDWTPETKLRDVLVVISCLLVSPNPASALNAEAGRLCEGDYAAFERRAKTWVNIHARVSHSLKAAVETARRRGEEEEDVKNKARGEGEGGEDNINTLRRGRGKRRLVGAVEDGENGRDSKRRSRSGSASAVRSTKPLATALDNALGIADVDMRRMDSVVEPPSSTPRLSQGVVTQMSPPQRTPRRSSQHLPVPSQGLDFPTFTTLNTTFEGKQTASGTTITTMPWHLSGLNDRFESSAKRKERIEMEERRMKAAGGDVRKYNVGVLGPRTGLFRL